jgi:F-type H+-transporting ATPase subunit b
VNSAITQFADSSSGIGALGIDGKAFIIQLVTFLLAFWVLKRFAFTPIIKLMDERRKTIEDGVLLGEKMKVEEADMQQKVAKALADSRKEADAIISEAQDTAKTAVREAEDKAREKAQSIVDAADERIKADTKRARKQLEGELVSLISDATEAIIGEKVDATKDAALIDKALKGQA